MPTRSHRRSSRCRTGVVDGAWNRYQQKSLSNEAIVTFGFGDGGGGPTDDMLEKLRRADKGVPGLAQAKIDTATSFFKNLKKNINKKPELLPSWRGELYLEFHRGTYTGIAKNKRNNRKPQTEVRLRGATEAEKSFKKFLKKMLHVQHLHLIGSLSGFP